MLFDGYDGDPALTARGARRRLVPDLRRGADRRGRPAPGARPARRRRGDRRRERARAGRGQPAARAPGGGRGRGARRARRRVGQPAGGVRGPRRWRAEPRRRCATASPRCTRARGRRVSSSSCRRCRCCRTASRTGCGCGHWRRRPREGLLDPAAHPVPRDHRPRGRAARGCRRLGRVEPVPRVRRPRGRAVAALCRGGGRRRLAGAGARPRAGQRHRARGRSRAGAPDRVGGRLPRPPRSRWPSPARRSPTTRPGVEAVRDALGPGAAVRVDANGAWSVDDAVVGDPRCSTGPPVGSSTSSSRAPPSRTSPLVRRRVDVPIAADESIRRAEDPYRVRDLEAADIAVLKVQPLGGVRACLRIAEDIGLPVVVSSALETSVGIAAGLALAGALPELPYACGLATVQLLTADVVAEPLVPVDGFLPVGAPVVDPPRSDLLARDRRPGGALGGPPRRGARVAAVTSTDLARAVVIALRRGRRHRGRAWRRGRATRRSSFAAFDAAEAGLLRLHTRIDERTAGFLALGLTKVGSRAAVVCTSGTAVANLHPAVLEARARRRADGRGHRRPARAAARHERQPDHRPGRRLRLAGAGRRRRSTAGCRPSSATGRCTSTSSSTTRWCPATAGTPDLGRRGRSRRVATRPERRPARPAVRAPSWSRATTPVRRPASLAQEAGWPLLAEPTSGARNGANVRAVLPAAARRRRSAGRSSGSWWPVTRRCPGRSRGCCRATTSRSST